MVNRDHPMISVTLPCFNHDKYVRESIESVLNQTYKDFELIIIENGSEDSSREIIREYENRENVRVIYFDENDQHRAEVVFRQEIKGKYVAFMTSDDLWLPEKLEKQIQVLEEHQEYEMCFSWAEYGDENMQTIFDNTYTLFKQENRTPEQWLRRFLEAGNCLCAPSFLMRRDIYINLDIKGVSFWQLYDEYLWADYLLKGGSFFVYPQVLVKMRRHGQAISFSLESEMRTYNEETAMRLFIIENMTDEQYLKAFSDMLVYPNARLHEEVVCEKILLLFILEQNNVMFQQIALEFYYRHYCEKGVADTFAQTYGLKKQYFVERTGQMGALAAIEKACAKNDKPEDELAEYCGNTASLLIDCYGKVIRILESGQTENWNIAFDSLEIADGCMVELMETNQLFSQLLPQEEWEKYLKLEDCSKKSGAADELLPWLYRLKAYLECYMVFGKV